MHNPELVYGSQQISAFTLAEVLITLGIIGVVAAMTMPTLIANHKKQVVVTRMQKFYSVFNQAIKRSAVDNEDVRTWNNVTIASDGNSMKEWWDKYLGPYMQITSTKILDNGILNSLSDGSGFGVVSTCSNDMVADFGASRCIHVYFCTEYNKCEKQLKSRNIIGNDFIDGKNTFLFHIDSKERLTAYAVGWDDDDRETLKTGIDAATGCNTLRQNYCARLIQIDGWRIEKDYPIGF